jgi:OmpA-OmpF porin, OOP family
VRLAALLLIVSGTASSTTFADTAPPPMPSPGATQAEIAADALCRRLEARQAVPLYRLAFAAGKAQLKPDGDATLGEIAKCARLLKAPLVIAAHTDAQGDAEWNRRLSRDRAEAVRAWLIAHGSDEGRLVAEGAGEDRPIADNRTAEGRAKNRRIELSLKAP